MNETKLKRIIAREGLIIIGLVFASLALSLFASLISSINFVTSYELKNPNGQHLTVKLSTNAGEAEKSGENENKKLEPTNAEWDEIVKQKYSLSSASDFDKKITHKNLPSSLFQIIRIMASAMSKVAALLVFAAYPVYWLIRFLLWAVKTLKKS